MTEQWAVEVDVKNVMEHTVHSSSSSSSSTQDKLIYLVRIITKIILVLK